MDNVTILPDGSAFAVVSFPLPKDHWIYETDEDGFVGEPPVPIKMEMNDPKREQFIQDLIVAGKYALKASTRCGKEMDWDPDAVIQNLIVGMLGYWSDGCDERKE